MSKPKFADLVSPSGRYFVKTMYIDPVGTGWSCVKMEVFDYCHDLVATTERNYTRPFLHFVEDHAGSDWLIVSENYHGGYGVIDLHTGERFIHDPTVPPWYLGGKLGRKVGYLLRNHNWQVLKALRLHKTKVHDLVWKAIERLGASEYWCWDRCLAFDTEKHTLEIEGCYWAYPYEVVTYDFSDPRKVPYKILSRRDAEDEDDEAEEQE